MPLPSLFRVPSVIFPTVVGGAVASKAQDSQKPEPPVPPAAHGIVGSTISGDVVLTAASCGSFNERPLLGGQSQRGRAGAAAPSSPGIADMQGLSMETWSKVPRGICVQRRKLLGLSGVDLHQPQSSCGQGDSQKQGIGGV